MKTSLKDLLFVSVQLFLFLIYFTPVVDKIFAFPPTVHFTSLFGTIAGVAIVLISLWQLRKSLSPFPTPVEEGTLVESGLYKYARHPVYSGIILSAMSFGVFQGSTWKAGISIALWILFYFKSGYEEKLLSKRYEKYPAYQKRTGRFFPGM